MKIIKTNSLEMYCNPFPVIFPGRSHVLKSDDSLLVLVGNGGNELYGEVKLLMQQ